ncbi:hypothetical protein L7F22_057540 [Adiantum nelumboides]|nr:hypothetical protein [Adiantum nelumboides]
MEPSQVDSQPADLSFSSEVVPSTQIYPSSMSPFGNTFSSMIHAYLFEPPLGFAMPVPDAQVPTVVTPIHDSQQRMIAPVSPLHHPFATPRVATTALHPPTNAPCAISPSPSARVSRATSTASSNGFSNLKSESYKIFG